MSRRDKDPREPTPCRYCKAGIIWARNERTNKPMPFDEQPDRELAKGWELFVRNDEALARYVREGRPGQRLRKPHFETCTNYDPSSRGPKNAPNPGTAEREAQGRAPPQQQDLVGRDHMAEVRAAMPPAHMRMYGQ